MSWNGPSELYPLKYRLDIDNQLPGESLVYARGMNVITINCSHSFSADAYVLHSSVMGFC